MSNPYNPNGADDQNDKPDFTAEPTPETSSEQTTEFGSTSGSTSGSADSAASEWGTPSQSADSSQSQYGQGGYTPYGETQYGQGGYGQGGYGPQGQYGVPSSNNGRKKPGDGFFQALFDFSFSRFITIDFAKVIYAIFLGLIALAWAGGLIASLIGFSEGVGEGFLGLIVYLIMGTALALFATVGARLSLEFYVATVKTAQNTSQLVELEQDKADSNS